MKILEIITLLDAYPKWKDYQEYCKFQEKHENKAAQQAALKMLEETKHWNLAQRAEFVEFLVKHTFNGREFDKFLCSYLFERQLILPTLTEISERNPKDVETLKMLYAFTHDPVFLHKILEISPDDLFALSHKISNIQEGFYYDCHHLPDYFLGEPSNCRAGIETYRELCSKYEQLTKKSTYSENTEKYIELTINYLEWRESDTENFVEWAKLNNKRYDSGVKTFYG